MGRSPRYVGDGLAGRQLADSAPPERGDAARNRALLIEAAWRLIAERGVGAITMNDVATAAGVGNGTLFRRFGSRAGLMASLLDEDERAEQEAFMFGPPPLGPGAPPLDRLIAYSRVRLRFVWRHRALLAHARRDPQTRFDPPRMLHRLHVRMLLTAAGASGDLDAQAEALSALLDPQHIGHQLTHFSRSLDAQSEAWESLVRKLCITRPDDLNDLKRRCAAREQR